MEPKKNHKTWRLWRRVLCFALILLMLLAVSSWALYPRDNSADSGITFPDARGFYTEPENTIDVYMVGNSGAYAGFSPMELWSAYGITSYVSGEPKQQIAAALTLLEEFLKRQRPKVILFETDEIFTGESRLNSVIPKAIESKLPVFKYHNNWKHLKLSTLFKKPNYTYVSPTKGQAANKAVNAYTGAEYMTPTDRVAKIPASTRLLLNRLVSLCREENIPLVLVDMPCALSWSYARHNAVQAFADENGLYFMDFNTPELRASTGFSRTTDTYDGGNHLNCVGARKMTCWIGDYLRTNYSLTDHRSDEALAPAWNADLEKYRKAYGK